MGTEQPDRGGSIQWLLMFTAPTGMPLTSPSAEEKPQLSHGKDLSPVIHDSTNRRQPVDSEGRVGLPNDHGWDRNGGGLSALTPLLIHKVQIAMHAGHLVRGEAVSAVIICGNKKGTGEMEVLTCKIHLGGTSSASFTPVSPAPNTTPHTC